MKTLSLGQLPLFASLPPEELQQLEDSMRKVVYAPGEVLFHEGDPGDRLYLILDGQLEVIKAMGQPHERILAVRGLGDFIGEMSLLYQGGKRSASVRTIERVRVMVMSRQDFDMLLDRQPGLAVEIMRSMSERLREAEESTIQDLKAINKQLAQAYQDLQAAQAQLIEKEKLEHELNIARKIQESILPNKPSPLGAYDFGARMVPARAVGGDSFDFIPLEGDRLGIAVGDVSDKGVPAALFMAMFSSQLRVVAQRLVSPAEVLRQVNRHLLQQNKAGMFVTAIYGVLDTRSGAYEYARAGHETPLLFDARGQLIELPQATGHPLGILPEIALDLQTLNLPSGGTLLLYSDGVTDASDPQKRFFGLDRLTTVAGEHASLNADEFCARLLQALVEFRASAEQFDDITLVSVHARP